MNKREVVWLIVRLIGLYFVYSAVVTLFTLASSVSALYSLSDGATPKVQTENVHSVIPSVNAEPPEIKAAVKTDTGKEKLKSDAFKTILFYILLTGVYGGLGFYLLAKGGILFNILSKEVSTARREDDTVTTLKL